MSVYHHVAMSAHDAGDLYVFNTWYGLWELATHYGSETIYGVRSIALASVKHFSIDYHPLNDGRSSVQCLRQFRNVGIRGVVEIDLTPAGYKCSRLAFFSEEDAVAAQALCVA